MPRGGTRRFSDDQALCAFALFVEAHCGIPPTCRELADALGLEPTQWTNGGYRYYAYLRRAGFIRDAVPEAKHRTHGSRTYVLTERGRARLAELRGE